jgi:hypothetical protein
MKREVAAGASPTPIAQKFLTAIMRPEAAPFTASQPEIGTLDRNCPVDDIEENPCSRPYPVRALRARYLRRALRCATMGSPVSRSKAAAFGTSTVVMKVATFISGWPESYFLTML